MYTHILQNSNNIKWKKLKKEENKNKTNYCMVSQEKFYYDA